MRRLIVFFIHCYRVGISPIMVQVFGPSCRYTPSCSEYAKQMIWKKGILKGSALAICRLLSCQPFVAPFSQIRYK